MQNPIDSISPLLLENITEGIVYQNLQGEILYANKAALRILGLTNDQILGRTSFDPNWYTIKKDGSPFPGHEHPAIVALKTGQPQEAVIMGVHKSDGSLSWIQINSLPLKDEQNRVTGCVTSFADVTKVIFTEEKLVDSEITHRVVLSSMQEGIFLVDRNFKIITINERAKEFQEAFFKKSSNEGDDFFKLASKERIESIKRNMDEAFAGKKIQYEIKHEVDGKPVWYHVSFSPVQRDKNSIDYICATVNDITEKKEIEEVLRNTEKKIQVVLSRLGDNFWEHDFTTNQTYFSEWVNELAAYMPGFNSRNADIWWKSTHPDDRWILEENDRKYKERLIDHHISEYRILHKDGSIRWVLDRGVVIEKDEDGNPKKIIGTHTDITERKKIEEAIKESERKFRAIFNSTFQFMGLMTTDGILLEANQTATEFFQLPKEEVMGMNFVDSRWFSDTVREKSKAALTLAARGKTVSYELELNLLDGRKVVIDFSIRPIFDEQGKVILLIPEGRDITEKIKMEKELEQQRTQRKKEILDAGIEGQEKQRREIARELHDNINQVLATIKVYLQLASENENMRRELIKKSHENVTHLIEEVRKLSKALAPPTLDDTTLIEALEQLVNDMILSLLYEIQFNNKAFDENLVDNKQKMVIYRIVQEQFTNILKYSRAKKITVSLATINNEILLDIEDDGIGFDTSTRNNGIGIKNMMNRVESQNGQFLLTSSPGMGCRIQIKLPLTKTVYYERN